MDQSITPANRNSFYELEVNISDSLFVFKVGWGDFKEILMWMILRNSQAILNIKWIVSGDSGERSQLPDTKEGSDFSRDFFLLVDTDEGSDFWRKSFYGGMVGKEKGMRTP